MFPEELRTAIELKRAIEDASYMLQPLGTSPSLNIAFHEIGGGIEDLENCSDEMKDSVTIPEDAEEALEDLTELRGKHGQDVYAGTLSSPFELKIFLPNYATSEVITSPSKPGDERESPALEKILATWFEHGDVSGFGDVRVQETRVDMSVRNAREIPADAFSVPASLLSELESIWAKTFYPSRVRAEPYKVHLYGPGGFFKPHRDTPQTGLVGTMLVGLGDTKWCGALEFEDEDGKWYNQRFRATRGTWVAFYPDVAHKVEEYRDGYRAVVAFKIFVASDDSLPLKRKRNEEHPLRVGAELSASRVEAGVLLDASSRPKIAKALGDIPTPYGLLLAHNYCTGTQQPHGFDAALLAAAQGLRTREVHLLPVLTDFSGLRSYERPEDCYTKSTVYPLTPAHVSAILAKVRDANGSTHDELDVDLAGTDAEWITARGVKDVPFYSLNSKAATVKWRHEEHEEDYTGNESSGTRADSLYLSYAMVVLDQPQDVGSSFK